MVINLLYILLFINKINSEKIYASDNYIFKPLDNTIKSLNFQIKCSSSAYICLSSFNAQKNASMYEIIIGDSKNLKTLIKRVTYLPNGYKTIISQKSASTPNILNFDEYRSFLLTWKNGIIQLMNKNITIDYTDPDNNFDIKFYGYKSKTTVSDWVFELPLIQNPIIINLTQSEDYKFYELITKSNSLLIQVKAKQEIYILLSQINEEDEVPYCEITIGKNKNKRSSISCEFNETITNNNSSDATDSFLVDSSTPQILNEKLMIEFTIEWNNSIKIIKNNTIIMELKKIPLLLVQYYGIRGASGNTEWLIQVMDSKTTTTIVTNTSLSLPISSDNNDEISTNLNKILSIIDALAVLLKDFSIKSVTLDLFIKLYFTTKEKYINLLQFSYNLLQVINDLQVILTLNDPRIYISKKDYENTKTLINIIDKFIKGNNNCVMMSSHKSQYALNSGIKTSIENILQLESNPQNITEALKMYINGFK